MSFHKRTILTAFLALPAVLACLVASFGEKNSAPRIFVDSGRLHSVLGVLLPQTSAAEPPLETQRPQAASRSQGVGRVNDIVYGKGGERELRLDIIRPATQGEAPLPLVVWVHGGAWLAGSKQGGPAGSLAAQGYVVASVEYRLSGEAIFPAQIEDCKCAIRYLRAHAKKYGIDPDRIGVWGSSAGGHLVALLGTSGGVKELEGKGGWQDQSSRVQAVCDWFGPTDFNEMRGSHSDINSPECKLVGGSLTEKADLVRAANPITYVTPDDPPFLIMHGEDDRTVPINQSELLNDALKKAGVEVTFVRVKNAGHGFGGGSEPNSQEIRRQILAFFDRHLKKTAK
jgi:acetyl esterase/lipase